MTQTQRPTLYRVLAKRPDWLQYGLEVLVHGLTTPEQARPVIQAAWKADLIAARQEWREGYGGKGNGIYRDFADMLANYGDVGWQSVLYVVESYPDDPDISPTWIDGDDEMPGVYTPIAWYRFTQQGAEEYTPPPAPERPSSAPTKQRGGKRPGAGRPRKHATPEELNRHKQAAYRERKRLEAQALAMRLEQLARDTKGLAPTAQHDLLTATAFLLGKPAPPPPTAQQLAGTQSLFPDLNTPTKPTKRGPKSS